MGEIEEILLSDSRGVDDLCYSWANDTRVDLVHLVTSLAAFWDDHPVDIPDAIVSREKCFELLEEMDKHEGKISLAEQMKMAQHYTDGNPWSAGLLLAESLRYIARGRDNSIMKEEPDINMGIRILSKLVIHEHATEPTGDPYHWWTMWTLGSAQILYREKLVQEGKLDIFYQLKEVGYVRLLKGSSRITRILRELMFGHAQEAGDHQDIDASALREGMRSGMIMVGV